MGRPEAAILPSGAAQRMRLPWAQALPGQELSVRKAESIVRRWQARAECNFCFPNTHAEPQLSTVC